jgi:hypothetical protein
MPATLRLVPPPWIFRPTYSPECSESDSGPGLSAFILFDKKHLKAIIVTHYCHIRTK